MPTCSVTLKKFAKRNPQASHYHIPLHVVYNLKLRIQSSVKHHINPIQNIRLAFFEEGKKKSIVPFD